MGMTIYDAWGRGRLAIMAAKKSYDDAHPGEPELPLTVPELVHPRDIRRQRYAAGTRPGAYAIGKVQITGLRKARWTIGQPYRNVITIETQISVRRALTSPQVYELVDLLQAAVEAPDGEAWAVPGFPVHSYYEPGSWEFDYGFVDADDEQDEWGSVEPGIHSAVCRYVVSDLGLEDQ